MHESIFESGWQTATLMDTHRSTVAPAYRSQGRSVLSLDWTLTHHPYSHDIYGAKSAHDYVNNCWSLALVFFW